MVVYIAESKVVSFLVAKPYSNIVHIHKNACDFRILFKITS